MVRNIFGFTLVATILIYANLQVLGRQLVGLVLIWKTGDARHNARPRVTLGSTLWELPPLDGAWESDGRRVKTRILGPNVKGRLNRRNKRGSRREKRLNMPGIRLTEASCSVFAILFSHQNHHQSRQQSVFTSVHHK